MAYEEASTTVEMAAEGPGAGLRAGAIVFAGIVLANLGNYGFQLIAARSLGPAPYGDLSTLLALVSLIGLPLGGLQLWVARHVAEYRAVGDLAAAQWFFRRSMIYTSAVAVAATALFLALAAPAQEALSIGSLGAVLLTALVTFPAVITPVVWGLAQGLERFMLISAMVASAPTVRIAIAVAGFAAGFGVDGAMAATLASNLLTLVVPVWLVRRLLRPVALRVRPVDRRDAARTLAPALIGLLAFTALTTVDVVVAKRTLGDHATGIYGSASLGGRVLLYLPSAVITVLLPRVAARTAGRKTSLDLLGRSLLATLAFCGAGTLVCATMAGPLIRIAFGSDYLKAAPLLWRFAIAMSAFALLNVLFAYHLGKRQHVMSWLLGVGALAQLGGFWAFHGSGRQLVGVDIVVAFALLAAHELLTRWTLTRAVAMSLRR